MVVFVFVFVFVFSGANSQWPMANSLQLCCLVFNLFRRFPIKVYTYDKEGDIGYPHGDNGRGTAIDGKGGGDGLEHDVAEAERNADTQVEAHAALDLLDGERQADEREDEGGKRGGDTLVVLDLKLLDVGDAAAALLLDIGLQLGRGERLLLVLRDEQVVGLDLDDGVHLQTIGDMLQGIGEDAVLPVLGLP